MSLKQRLGIAALVVTLASIITSIVVSINHRPAPIGDPSEMFFPGRYEYQQSLNESPQRFAPELSLTVIENRLYERTDFPRKQSLGACDIRCGTISDDRGFVSVGLPVGYVHGNNSTPMPTSWQPVTELTFWNPVSHLRMSIQSDTPGKGVTLPDFLQDYRSAEDLKPGESAYTVSDFIRQRSDGSTYMIDGILAYEKLGSNYGSTLDTTVTKKNDGSLEVRLPEGSTPLRRKTSSDAPIVPVSIVS